MTMAESAEMYLETILVIKEEKGLVRSVDIAEKMNFSKPSVSRAMHILEEAGYLKMDENHLITLTDKGMEIATTIYERHKLLSVCLRALGVPPDIAVQDACKMEHDISPETFEALKRHAEKMKNSFPQES